MSHGLNFTNSFMRTTYICMSSLITVIIFIFALTRNIKNHAQDIHNNRNMFKTN